MKHLLIILTLVSIFASISASPTDDFDDTDLDLIDEFLNPEKTDAESVPSTSPANLQRKPSSTTPIYTEPKEVEELEGSCEFECVKYYECDTKKESGRKKVIDVRAGYEKQSQCPNYLDVCCEAKVEEMPEEEEDYEHTVCGKRNEEGIGFTLAGDDTQSSQFGEFPWTTAILEVESISKNGVPRNVYICGGSLIHPQVIVTAAHCVQRSKVQQLKVRAGEYDTLTPNEPFPHQDRKVKQVVLHEGYYPGALYNDIALLFLEEPFELKQNVETICLPPADINFNGETCFASGWGKDSYGSGGRFQATMKKVELPIVPFGRCQAALRKSRLGSSFRLHNSFICGGGLDGMDTCKGDGGSPLVCKMPDSKYYTLYGLVSWGIGCNDGTPGVYVNVAKFVPWISKQMRKNRMELSYSTLPE